MNNLITILNAILTDVGSNTTLINRNNGNHCIYGFLLVVLLLSIYTFIVTLKEINK